ncbi:MAG: peptidoglycan-binding domain-containing protein [Granulosicoccaceae bacterium]
MNITMQASTTAQALGFTGLTQFVSDVDAIIEHCRHGDRLGIDDDLIAEIWDEEPELQVAPRRTRQRTPQTFEQGEKLELLAPVPKKSSILPALASVAVILATGVVTFGLMQYLEQRRELSPEMGSLSLAEAQPPVGRGLVLNPAQIRYCIAQGIRLSTASEQGTALSREAENKLADLYEDYDSRCAEYRFQAGAFDQARRDVENRRLILEREGLALLSPTAEPVTPETAAAIEAPKQAPQLQIIPREAPVPEVAGELETQETTEPLAVFDGKARKYIKDLQWRLFKLKYYQGPIDGVDSPATQRAIRGFFSVHHTDIDQGDETAVFRAIEERYQNR